MKLADALVTTLRDWDVRYLFGVSGANIEHVHDAVHRLGDGRLQSVLAKSEVGAAFMADARARTHRTLGVCCSTSGGGMMNLAVGIAESYAESVPVLAIVGQVPSAMTGRGGFQDSSGIGRSVDAVGLFRSIAKHVAKVERAGDFWRALHEAARAALSGRAGPSVLLFARDVYELEVGERPPWLPARLADLAPPAPLPDLSALDRALRRAERPVLVLGTGVERSPAAEHVRRFAVEANIPVATTMASTGAFPNDHPLYLGMVGAAGHPSAHAFVNHQADLVVAVGTGLNALTRHPIGRAVERVRLAVVNVDAGEIARAASPDVIVEADAGAVFRALRERRHDAPYVHRGLDGYALTRYVPRVVDDRAPESGPEPPLLQSEAIELLEPHLPHEGHIFFDAGNCAVASLHALTIPRGATTTIALGMGGMGYAIAGAIGAQLGSARGARSVVLCGDGAFLMLGFEVHTAIELELPILFVVFNNGAHGMCATRQRAFFEGRIESSSYGALDACTVARGLGAERLWVGRAATRGQLVARLDEWAAEGEGRPGVLELVLAREEVPPFSIFLEPDAPTYVARPPQDPGRRAKPAA